MSYEAHIVEHGESLSSRQGNNSNQLLAWLLTELEGRDCPNTVGTIKNTLNSHEPARVYTTHNPHSD